MQMLFIKDDIRRTLLQTVISLLSIVCVYGQKKNSIPNETLIRRYIKDIYAKRILNETSVTETMKTLELIDFSSAKRIPYIRKTGQQREWGMPVDQDIVVLSVKNTRVSSFIQPFPLSGNDSIRASAFFKDRENAGASITKAVFFTNRNSNIPLSGELMEVSSMILTEKEIDSLFDKIISLPNNFFTGRISLGTLSRKLNSETEFINGEMVKRSFVMTDKNYPDADKCDHWLFETNYLDANRRFTKKTSVYLGKTCHPDEGLRTLWKNPMPDKTASDPKQD